MFIGYLKVNLFIPYSQSLKERRKVLSKIKDGLRRKFNVSIAEKPLDKWQTAEISLVCVNYTKRCVDETMMRIEEYLRYYNDIHIIDTERSIL